MKLPSRPEEAEQRAVAQYLDMRRDLVWCHVPNGGARHRAEGGKLKAQGVKPGVPDVLIFTPTKTRRANGTAIELKRRDGGEVQESQKVWIDKLICCGWQAHICNGSDESIDLIKRLYGE